jgi:hypothetical protein
MAKPRQRQCATGATLVLRTSGAASGEIKNMIIARAASGSLETLVIATLDGHPYRAGCDVDHAPMRQSS